MNYLHFIKLYVQLFSCTVYSSSSFTDVKYLHPPVGWCLYFTWTTKTTNEWHDITAAVSGNYWIIILYSWGSFEALIHSRRQQFIFFERHESEALSSVCSSTFHSFSELSQSHNLTSVTKLQWLIKILKVLFVRKVYFWVTFLNVLYK